MNSMNGGTIQRMSSALMIVRTMLAGLESRFALTQPIAPVVTPGAGIASTPAVRT